MAAVAKQGKSYYSEEGAAAEVKRKRFNPLTWLDLYLGKPA